MLLKLPKTANQIMLLKLPKIPNQIMLLKLPQIANQIMLLKFGGLTKNLIFLSSLEGDLDSDYPPPFSFMHSSFGEIYMKL